MCVNVLDLSTRRIFQKKSPVSLLCRFSDRGALKGKDLVVSWQHEKLRHKCYISNYE